MPAPLPIELFDFALPPQQIAQHPVHPRHHSRLLMLPRHDGPTSHHRFDALGGLLRQNDLLVVNRSRVIPARLRLRRESGGRVEVLLCRPVDGPIDQAHTWVGMGRPGKAFAPGARLFAPDGTPLSVVRKDAKEVSLRCDLPMLTLLQRHGEVPLPPYIKREAGPQDTDVTDYQTVFAKEPGAVAAPTASLHFTEELLNSLRQRGINFAEVLLHVGLGTFMPVPDECASDVRQHLMHGEWFCVPDTAQELIAKTQRQGGRVIAVGTTVARALESWKQLGRHQGESHLFIYPGYEFKAVNGLITNFHLPKSTLLMMVSAFAGRERVLAAYDEAVRLGYRFFSYGDAMLIV